MTANRHAATPRRLSLGISQSGLAEINIRPLKGISNNLAFSLMNLKLSQLICTTSLSISMASAIAIETTTFRCGRDIVSLHESKYAVLQKCGEPLFEDSFCKPGTLSGPPFSACEIVDEWTYAPGPGQFITTLQFEFGRLVHIIYGDRVR